MNSQTLLFHQTSQNQIEQLIKNIPHFVILSGKIGVGLKTTALYIAKELESQPIIVSPDEKGTIKIDTVRMLYQQLRTKDTRYKIVIIDDADTMAIGAQNVLLKLLEEPPARTSFILTSHTPFMLLETIRSRAQHVGLLPISSEQSNSIKVLRQSDTVKQNQVLFLADGLPAEIARLTNDETYFSERSLEMRAAREFLRSDSYNRLVQIYKLGNNREQALGLIQNALFITALSLKQRPDRSLVILLQKLITADEKLRNDGNIKSQLIRLAL